MSGTDEFGPAWRVYCLKDNRVRFGCCWPCSAHFARGSAVSSSMSMALD